MRRDPITLEPDLIRSCEAAEMAAVESWMQSAPPGVARQFGVGSERLGDALLIHANADVLMFNRVIGLGALESRIEPTLETAVARFREFGSRRFMVQVAPGPWHEKVARVASSHGFYEHNYWIRLARDASPAPAARTDLTLKPLPPSDARALGTILVAGFDHPPEFADWYAAVVAHLGWQFFGAYDGDLLVGGAGLFVHRDTAHFGFAGTRSEFRGRGAQSALIARRIAAALAAGCERMVVETAADKPEKPNPSTHNLRRFGFRDLYQRQNWVKTLEGESA